MDRFNLQTYDIYNGKFINESTDEFDEFDELVHNKHEIRIDIFDYSKYDSNDKIKQD